MELLRGCFILITLLGSLVEGKTITEKPAKLLPEDADLPDLNQEGLDTTKPNEQMNILNAVSGEELPTNYEGGNHTAEGIAQKADFPNVSAGERR